MQLSLKAYYLSKCVDKKTLEVLFEMFDKNNIEYKPLAIPISSLDIDKFIDPQEFLHIVESVEFRGIIPESVIFDFYLPEFGYIFNLDRMSMAANPGMSDAQRLEKIVNESVSRADSRAKDWERIEGSMPDITWNFMGELSFLKKATMDYLNSKGIKSLFSVTNNITDSINVNDDNRLGPIAVAKIPALETALLAERLKK